MTNSLTSVLAQWSGGGEFPVQYDISYSGWTYYLRYRSGTLTLFGTPGDAPSYDDNDELLYEAVLSSNELDGTWNDGETNVYLFLLTDAIIHRSFSTLTLPLKSDVRNHPQYQHGPLPHHPVGMACGVHEPSPPVPPGLNLNRHTLKKRRAAGIHDHDANCLVYVPANELDAWIAAHPTEHDAFKRIHPIWWQDILRAHQL